MVALLLNGLKDENESVRQSAMFALSQLSNPSEAVVYTLLEMLEKDNSIVRIDNKTNYTFTKTYFHFKKNHIAIFFERFLHHPFLIVYLSSYFHENHLLCIDHENKQLILSLYNKAYKISFSQEILIHLEKQARSIAQQLYYPYLSNIFLDDKLDEEQPAANSIAEAGLNDALVQTQSHCESKADSDCPEEKDTLLKEPKNAKTAQSEYVKGRLFNQGQNGRMSTVESIDHKNLQTPSSSSNVYSYWNKYRKQIGIAVLSTAVGIAAYIAR